MVTEFRFRFRVPYTGALLEGASIPREVCWSSCMFSVALDIDAKLYLVVYSCVGDLQVQSPTGRGICLPMTTISQLTHLTLDLAFILIR